MSQPYGANWPPGAVISMYDETLRIRENHGDRGVVEYLDGEPVSSCFYWMYQGDKAELVSLPQRQH